MNKHRAPDITNVWYDILVCHAGTHHGSAKWRLQTVFPIPQRGWIATSGAQRLPSQIQNGNNGGAKQFFAVALLLRSCPGLAVPPLRHHGSTVQFIFWADILKGFGDVSDTLRGSTKTTPEHDLG